MINKYLLVLLSLLGLGTARAQSSFDVRLRLKTLNCTTGKAVVQVDVRAHSGSPSFLMGDANFRFRYNPQQIANPTIVSQDNFSSGVPALDVNYQPQNLQGSIANATVGIVSLNVLYSGINGAKSVGSDWLTAGCVQFDLLTTQGCINLTWNTNASFPPTGMNEVSVTSNLPFTYTTLDVAAGGVFENLQFCPTPTATATANGQAVLTVCGPTSVTLNATGGTGFSWSGLTGFLSGLASPLLGTVSTSTSYTVTVTASTGCTTTATTSVQIISLPTLDILNPGVNAGTIALCAGEALNLSITSGLTNYAFSGPGGFTATSINPTLNLSGVMSAVAGIYTIVGTASGANSCSNSTTVSLSVNALPTLNVLNGLTGGTLRVCVGDLVNLSVGAGLTNYSFTGPSGFISSGLTPTLNLGNATTALSGVYSIVGTGANGCSNTTTLSITTNPLPILNILNGSISGGVLGVCLNSPLNLSVTNGLSNYSFSGPAGFISSGITPTLSIPSVTNTLTGVYSVVGTDANGCINTATVSVSTNPLPILNILNSNLTGGVIRLCVGDLINLSATTGLTNYAFSGPAGFISSGVTPTLNLGNATTTLAGVYSIVGTNSNGCTNTTTLSLSVNILPNLGILNSGVDNGLLKVCVGDQLFLSVTNGLTTYAFSGPNAFSSTGLLPTVNLGSVTSALAGVYTITATNSNSCSNTTTLSLSVNVPSLVNILNPGVINNTLSVCVGNVLNLSLTNGLLNYAISGPNAFSSMSSNPILNVGAVTNVLGGIYSITGTDANSCRNTTTLSLSVNALPVLNILNGLTGGVLNVCQGSPLNLSVTNGLSNYLFSGPAGFTSSGLSPVANIGNAAAALVGIYTIIGTDANTCSSSTTVSVLVNLPPLLSILNSGLSGNTLGVCIGDILNLSLTPGLGGYLINGPLGFTSSGISPTINLGNVSNALAGVYSITGTGTNNCTTTTTLSLSVNAQPVINILNSNVVGGVLGACAGEALNLSITAGLTNYLLNGPNGFSSSSLLPVFNLGNATSALAGVYSVIGTNSNGCRNTTTLSIGVTLFAAVASSNSPVQVGQNLNLSVTAGNAYAWLGPASFSSAIQSPARVAVTTAMAGVYSVTVTSGNCSSTATTSVVVIDCVILELKVLLEGPYNSSTGLMKTTLNARGLLPGQTPVGDFAVSTPAGQPYRSAPWNYNGNESVTNYAADVVDWVLVSLRTNANSTTAAYRAAGLLHADGTITFPNGCASIPANGQYFVLIEHRNHLGVLSSSAVPVVGGKITFDFSLQDSFTLNDPPSFGQVPIGTKWLMYACDGRKSTFVDNYDINFNDSQLWKTESGIFDQYLRGDFNMDADVNFLDNILWKKNSGRYSGVVH